MKNPKPDRLHRLHQELSQDITFVAQILTNHAVDTNNRFKGMAEDMRQMSRRIEEGLLQAGADSEKRFNQLAGRMRQMEQRLTVFLGAADRDRTEHRQQRGQFVELERRVSEIERRLPPPAA